MTELVEAEIDDRPVPGSIARLAGRYPWPIQDSLRTANDLANLSRYEGDYADLALELEKLVGGVIGLSELGELQFTPDTGAKPIGIHLTSSVVKSLTGLVFFFRHQAHAGNLLMIDEPELNLHPDNQRKLARILARAVNRGLRLIMSTHSDYILREFNNLILLSSDAEAVKEIRDRHGYKETELLAPEKLGVYLFRSESAEEVKVTKDGFAVQTIEDEINRLNQISQEIYAALL